jgi:hypothetical protein
MTERPSSILAEEILAKHTDMDGHDHGCCSACGDNTGPGTFVSWPCDAVRLARLVLGVTRAKVTPENNSFWVGRDPSSGKAVLAHMPVGEYTEEEINDWLRKEQDKFQYTLTLRSQPNEP